MSDALWISIEGDSRAPVELPRQGMLSIGSSSSAADLRIEADGVADVHCAIGRIKGGGWALKDLGSDQGTRVNGKRLKTARLKVGDQLQLGSARLVVQDTPRQQDRQKAPAPSATSAAASQPADSKSKKSAPMPQIAGFELERPLGRGAMGSVFLALQESLQRKVALKVMERSLAGDQDFVKRFVEEARSAAALHHANVVTVFDVGSDGDKHYLAMEFMERGNLESRVARHGALSVDEVLKIFTDATQGLVFAEKKGIVHRDIKPANLMQNAAGQTKIADLGLAQRNQPDGSLAGDLDETKIFGTPHFIAPEQARGERVDARSDLYSLGATVYRLLSGRTPFSGETTREILRGHFFDEPKPLGELVEGLPPKLGDIVARLLKKEPDQRYPSASALLADLEALARDPSPAAASGSGSAKKALVGGVVLALAATAGFFLLKGDAGQDSRSPDNVSSADPSGSGTGGPDPLNDADRDASETGQGSAGPAIAGDPEGPVGSEDAQLLAFEAEAEAAFAALPGDLVGEARAAELRLLAERFPGTTQATKAIEEALELERASAAMAERQIKATQALDQALSALAATGQLDGQPLPVGEAVLALSTLATDPSLIENGDYLAAQARLVEAALARGRAQAAEVLANAREFEGRGAFDESRAVLERAISELWLPEIPEALGTLQGASELLLERTELRQLLAELDDRRALYLWTALDGDVQRTAQSLNSGLREALWSLDLQTAAARLASLSQEAQSLQEQSWLAALEDDVERAQLAKSLLMSTHANGEWRRQTTLDPRSRGAKLDIRSVDESGVRTEDGEVVAWSAFAGATRELHVLFNERLERDYDARERAQIAALMRLSAVSRAYLGAREMFDPTLNARLGDDEKEEMLEGFAVAREWSGAGNSELLEAEERATRNLIRALEYSATESWSATTVAIESLFQEHDSTLLVRTFSDGSLLAGARPVAPSRPLEDELPRPRPVQEGGADSASQGSEPAAEGVPGNTAPSADDQ